MKIIDTPQFRKGLKKCPSMIQNKFLKQVAYLLHSLRHPSLHAKKYDKKRGMWQARVDRNYRFYFFYPQKLLCVITY